MPCCASVPDFLGVKRPTDGPDAVLAVFVVTYCKALVQIVPYCAQVVKCVIEHRKPEDPFDAPVTATAFCSQGPTGSPAPSEAPAAAAPKRGHPRPCQDGELEAMVLSNPRIGLSSLAAGDVAAGRIDPRVLEVLLVLAERFDLGSVGPLISAHSYFVAGTTTPSNHSFGRAVDISVIDGRAVSIYNPAARDAMELVLSLPPPLLPDELGGPWPMYHAGVRTFTQDHHDHVHIGWDG
jgi:hypothetical protein